MFKAKFTGASSCSKKVFEAAKLACAIKRRESITFCKLCSCDFLKNVLIVFSQKGKSAILFNSHEMLSSGSVVHNPF